MDGWIVGWLVGGGSSFMKIGRAWCSYIVWPMMGRGGVRWDGMVDLDDFLL